MRDAFIGRERELADMLAALDDAFQGQGTVFLLGGEPGIGKTTLAAAVASRAAARGARVAWSRSWEGGDVAPYWMWAQVVRSIVEGMDGEAPPSFMSAGVERVALLAPELANRFEVADLPALKQGLDSDAGRFYLFEATSRFLRQVSSATPLVLVLDDVLTGDEPSLLLLRFLARDIRSLRMLVVATYRDAAPRSDASVDVLADLVREGTGLDLRGLDREEVGRLITEVAGVVPVPGKAAAIHEATGGNPLFVREVTRLLVNEEPLDRPGRLRVPVPDTVRAVIRRRLAPLSADAVRVLAAAAVVGRHFDLALVDAACALPADRIVASLGEAIALGVVTETATVASRYRFSHPLMREAIYEGLPVAGRGDMHHRVGVAIERLHGSESTSHLGELAYHFTMAGVVDACGKALCYAQRAGDRAMEALAYEQAVVQYRRAVDALMLSGEPDPASHCELLLRLGRAQARAGDYQQGKATFLVASDLARESGTSEQLALAALGRGEPQVEGGLVDAQLVGLLEEALGRLGPEDSALRVKLLARLSLELTFADRNEVPEARRQELSMEALRMARRLERAGPLFSALRARWLVQWGPDGLDERRKLCEEWLALAADTGEREMELFARARRASCALEAGDITAAEVDGVALGRLADELRIPYHEWTAATMRAGRALLTGSLDTVETLAQDALDRMPGRPNAMHAHVNQLTTLRWAQGRLGELHGTWQHQVERYAQLAFPRGWLCLAAAELGREDEARGELQELIAQAPALPRDGLWLPAMALAAAAASRLGDADVAAVLYPMLRPYADHVALISMPHPAVCFGPVSMYLGVLAAELEAWDDAEQHFADAMRANQRLGATPFQARTYREHARLLIRRGFPSDRDRAAALLARAEALAGRLGLTLLLRDVEGLREELKEAPADRGSDVAVATGNARAATGVATAANDRAGPDGTVLVESPARAERRQGPSATLAAADDRPDAGAGAHVFRREGEYWSVAYGQDVVRLRDTKGLRCLARLLSHPGRELAAVDLEGAEAGAAAPVLVAAGGMAGSDELHDVRSDLGDAGALLDDQAKADYRSRIGDLRAELDEAERFNDPGRAVRAREELDFLTHELSRAVGLGGRDRRASSHAERARLNVTRAIRSAMRALARAHPSLGEHLAATVRTGRYCSYTPDPRAPIRWEI